jgi:hypothetical protein
MSDPRRLLHDEGSSEFEKSLVRSWDHEQPSNAARDATLVALGIGAGAAVTAAAGTASAAAGAGAAAGGSIAPKAAVGGLLFLKWWGISTVVVGTAVGAAWVVHAQRIMPPPVVPSSAPTETTAIVPVSPPRDFVAPTPIPTAPPTHATLQPRPTSSSLNDEILEMDRARAALDSSDPARALELVDAYESKHPHGSFVQEAEVLRIQALLARGDRAAAERTGNRFLATYPKSPHAPRVRSLLGFVP